MKALIGFRLLESAQITISRSSIVFGADVALHAVLSCFSFFAVRGSHEYHVQFCEEQELTTFVCRNMEAIFEEFSFVFYRACYYELVLQFLSPNAINLLEVKYKACFLDVLDH